MSKVTVGRGVVATTLIALAIVATAVIALNARPRSATTPSVADQYAGWLAEHTTADVQIDKVSCLDRTSGTGNAMCQFTAVSQGTYYHDFTCTAKFDAFDVGGRIAGVECPDNIAGVLFGRRDGVAANS